MGGGREESGGVRVRDGGYGKNRVPQGAGQAEATKDHVWTVLLPTYVHIHIRPTYVYI